MAQWRIGLSAVGQVAADAKPQPSIYGGAASSQGNDAARSSRLLHQARRAIAVADAQAAEGLLNQIRGLSVTYGVNDDSPQRVASLLQELQRFAKGPGPGVDRDQAKHDYAQFLLDQAEGLLVYQDIAAARSLAQRADSLKAAYNQFERTPQKLLQRIDQLAGVAGAGQSRPAANGASDSARQMMARAHQALQAGDLVNAEHWARQAAGSGAPAGAFGNLPGPQQMLQQIAQLKARRGEGVMKASNEADPNVRQGLYTPYFDPTRNIAAQNTAQEPAEDAAETQPVPLGPPGAAASELPADAGTVSAGRALYQQGVEALAAGNRDAALELFRRAWQYERELDAATRSQLKDKLQLMTAVPSTPPAGGDADSPISGEIRRTQLLKQKLFHEITTETAMAERERNSDPKNGLNRLQKLREQVAAEELDEPSKRQMLALVDRSIEQMKTYINQNRAQIELDQRNQRVNEGIAADRERLLQVQDKLAQLVEDFDNLMEERRFADAEAVARQAREIAPNNETVELLIWKSKFARRLEANMVRKELAEQGFVDALASVEDSAIPFDDRQPINFNGKKRWMDLTEGRRRLLNAENRYLSPEEQEIKRKLSTKVDVKFNDTPLGQALATLGEMAQVPIFIDPQGLASETVTTEEPITINLSSPIKLRSALNLILQNKGLGYVIENEVLRITSARAKETKTVTQVYNVADLVIPIPNFVPGYNVGLPAAIREAHAAAGYGTPIRQVGGGVPLTFAEPQDDQGSLVAQMQQSGVLAQPDRGSLLPPGLGRRPATAPTMNGGPGGLGGAALADFDTLIELITSTIAPETWDDVGGPGAIEPFPTNLSLVVSQTQEVHEQIADLLDQLRRLQDLQITIEVRFITLTDNFFERLGVDFDFNIDDNSGLNTLNPKLPDDAGPTVSFGLDPVTSSPTMDLDFQFRQDSFSGTIPQFGDFDAGSAANFGFAILSDIEVFFLLQAAHGDTRSNVLQAPKVTLFNGQSASVSDTSQRPFVTSIIPVVGDFAAAQQPVITVLSEGTTLSVQGVVSADRRFVRLTLVPFFSQIGDVRTFTFDGRTSSDTGMTVTDPDGNVLNTRDNATNITEGTTVQLPTFSFTTVSTTVSVPDGGTVLLGGIKRLREGRNERGVPMLNKLPYVNRLFKNVGIGRDTQSLMLMVTPRIIIQEEEERKLGILDEEG